MRLPWPWPRRWNRGCWRRGPDQPGVRYGSQSGSGDYYVLSHTTMPAILVELGFIQDQEDNRLLDRNLNQYAEAIADAVAGLVEGEQSS